jgi:hypothetical protein
MDAGGSFEEMTNGFDTQLKALLAAGDVIVTAIARMAAGVAEGGDPIDPKVVDEARHMLMEQQRRVHDRLAHVVEAISTVIHEERAAFDAREAPLRSDMLIGFLSKGAMRQRIERRALRAGGLERLRTSLGRADRLAGRIDAQRRGVMAQRSAAERLLADLPRSRDLAGNNGNNGNGVIGGAPDVVSLFAAVVDALNLAVRDLTLLLQKLIFDVERLLDHYSVLLSFRRDREAHVLSEQAYPYFGAAVGRLANDILPGQRLQDSRRKIELAFAERFIPA